MDESLAEAIRWFNQGVEQLRDTFVAILGHDLRDPLNAALMATELQKSSKISAAVRERAIHAAANNLQRIATLIQDVMDYARTRLTGTLSVSPQATDMRKLCAEIAEAHELSHPGRIRVDCSGDLSGVWDGSRMKQLVSNLVQNALSHGNDSTPVDILATVDGDDIVLSVVNEGPIIPVEQQLLIFDPIRHKAKNAQESGRQADGLGLGLYIVSEIVAAHGGSIVLHSDETGTSFVVRLPRVCKTSV
jgi:signal transduction histidine kinase